MDMKKAKTIAKAFVNKLPEGEDWYEKRLEICNSCDYNTKNKDRSELSVKDKLQIGSKVCDNGNHCTACGCCIERKCSVKTEECGAVKLGLPPKWESLETVSEIDDTLSIENLTPEVGKVTTDKTGFYYDFGEVYKPKISCKFRLKKSGGLDVINQSASCSCTVGDLEVIDKETTELSVDISTLTFKEGEETTRSLNVTYSENKRNKTIKITFKCKKNGRK